MARKKPYEPKPYESMKTDRRETFANVYHSMLISPAFMDLSPRAKTLYLYCKAQTYQKAKDERNLRNDEFTMNQGKWKDKYHLYTNANSFYADMNSLISHGFVDCVECGAIARKKSIYRLSVRWQFWGTDNFEVPERVKTMSLRRKESKQESKTDSMVIY